MQQRVCHGHGQQVLFELHRHAHTLQRDFFRDEDDRYRIGRVLTEVDVRETKLVGERLGNLLLGGEIHAHEDRA